MKNTKILTFELAPDGEQLEIHVDHEGLKELMECLALVLRSGRHDHLMTPDWGGSELTAEPQSERNRLLNKVSIYFWNAK